MSKKGFTEHLDSDSGTACAGRHAAENSHVNSRLHAEGHYIYFRIVLTNQCRGNGNTRKSMELE